MRLVNLQLKEQAEAAIRDKVATISVQDVLSDKQPIIEELTARLRAVAEGSSRGAGTAGAATTAGWSCGSSRYRSRRRRSAPSGCATRELEDAQRVAELSNESTLHTVRLERER